MPNFNTWSGAAPLGNWLNDINRAYDVERLITAKATNIVAIRAGASLPTQTIRLEAASSVPREIVVDAAKVSESDVIVIGYRGHPTIADTDLKRGDRFLTGDLMYEIIHLNEAVDLIAYAKAVS